MFNDVLSLYHSYYRKIFSVLYPAKNSTGFTERNLSVNFSKAYEALNPDSVSWFEFQFGERNNLHYDCIVVNAEKKEILIIESKRFSNPSSKTSEIENDITRINLSRGMYSEEFSTRINNFSDIILYPWINDNYYLLAITWEVI